MLRSKLNTKDAHGTQGTHTSSPTPTVATTATRRVTPAPTINTTFAFSVGRSTVTNRHNDMLAYALAEETRRKREEEKRQLETLRRQREEEDKFNRGMGYEQRRFDTQIAAAVLTEQTDLPHAIVLYSRALEIANSMQQIWNLKPKHYNLASNPSITAQATALGHLVRCYMATERHAEAYKLCLTPEIDASINRQHLINAIREDIQRIIRSKLRTLDVNLRDAVNRKSAESILQESRNLLRGVGLTIHSDHEVENLERQLYFYTYLAATLVNASRLCAQDMQNLSDYKPTMQQLNEIIDFLQANLASLDANDKTALKDCQDLQAYIQPMLKAQLERERITAEKALSIRIQQEIYTTLSKVAQHIDNGNLKDATSLLKDVKQLAAEFPADARQYVEEYKPSAEEEPLEFTPFTSFDDPITTLNQLTSEQSASHKQHSEYMAKEIITSALSLLTQNKFMHKQQAALLEPQVDMLQTFLSSVIQKNWQNFNNRPEYVMQFLTQALAETLKAHMTDIDLVTWLWHWSHANLKVDDLNALEKDLIAQIDQFSHFGSVSVIEINHPVIARKQQNIYKTRMVKEKADDTSRQSVIEQHIRNVYTANNQGNYERALLELKEARRNFILLHNPANINHDYNIDTINESIIVLEQAIKQQNERAGSKADVIVQQILDQALDKVSQNIGRTVLFEKHMESMRSQLLACVKKNWHKFDERAAVSQTLIEHLSQVLSQLTVDIGYVTAFWHWSYANRKLANLNSACKLSMDVINEYQPEQSPTRAVALPIFQAQVVGLVDDSIPMAVVVSPDTFRHTQL